MGKSSIYMERKVIFKNGAQLPSIGQGTWNMGDDPSKREEEIQTLRTGIELGLTVLDTAEMYGDGRSELLVGEAILGIRDKVFLISKVLPSHASLKGTKKACEESLKRLNTESLDLYLLHWQGRYPFSETVEAMLELQQEGKIRQWGVSNMDVKEMEEFYSVQGGDTCYANEVLYNLTRRGIEYDLIPWCQLHHLPIIAYSPVEQGRLLDNPVLGKIASRHDVTPAQVALAWVIRLSGILAIPKASTVKHVRENADSLKLELTENDLEELEKAFPATTRKKHLEII